MQNKYILLIINLSYLYPICFVSKVKYEARRYEEQESGGPLMLIFFSTAESTLLFFSSNESPGEHLAQVSTDERVHRRIFYDECRPSIGCRMPNYALHKFIKKCQPFIVFHFKKDLKP